MTLIPGKTTQPTFLEHAKDALLTSVDVADKCGVWTSENVVVPLLTSIVKESVSLTLAGLDLLRKLLGKRPLSEGVALNRLKRRFDSFERECTQRDPSQKVNFYRSVYGMAIILTALAAWPQAARDTDPEIGHSAAVETNPEPSLPKITRNRPPDEEIPNIETLKSVSIYQPGESRDYESGTLSYYETIDAFLSQLYAPGSEGNAISTFKLYKLGPDGQVHTLPVSFNGGKILVGGEAFHLRRTKSGILHFKRSLLRKTVGYKVMQDGVEYTGVSPQEKTSDLIDILRGIVGDSDVTMVHFRGHLNFGSDVAIPKDVLDPAIVNLGGCNSSDALPSAHHRYRNAALVALRRRTNWTANHGMARGVMKAIQLLKLIDNGHVTWDQLSKYLRRTSVLFDVEETVLPGDNCFL